jgi:hypothetical protein
MTQTFGLNANNDIYLDATGNLVILSGQDAVETACGTATKAQLGEMVLQTGLGIPNFQTIWVGAPNLTMFESYLRQTILSVDGVVSITSLSVGTIVVQNPTTGLDETNLTYTATIENIYGEEFTLNG